MAHVVIIGAGVGGVPCAYELRKKLGKQHRVTLLGSSPFFEFTPSNPWTAVGWRTREQTRVDLRRPLESKGIQWIPEPVTIDPAAAQVALASGAQIGFEIRR
jgi:sulfide:quinone oxidoreductase